MIEKHMNSMDYLAGNTAALKTPKEASAALFKDLQKAMDADTMHVEQTAIEASTCEHQWKSSVSGMWRHPLWSGRCIVWEVPPRTDKYDLVNGLLDFTLDPSMPKEKLAQKSIMGSMMMSTKGLEGDKNLKAMAIKDTFITDVTLSIAKDIPNLCYAGKDGQCTFLSAMMEPPVPMQEGQAVNRALLLADVFGVSTTNSIWCMCECCSAKHSKTMKKSERESGQVCKLEVVGKKSVTSADQCTANFCNLRFKQKCLGPMAIKAKQGDTKATFHDSLNAAKTCEDVMETPFTTEEQLKERAKYWLEKHHLQRKMSQTCINDVVTSNMAQAIAHLTTSRLSLKEGDMYLKLYILDGSTPQLMPERGTTFETVAEEPAPVEDPNADPSLLLRSNSFLEEKAANLATFEGYTPPPVTKKGEAGWTEARCTTCCPDQINERPSKYNGEPVDPKINRECLNGKTFTFTAHKAKVEQCTEHCPKSQTEKVAAKKEVEKINMAKHAASAAKSAQESGKLIIRLCALPNRHLPSLNIGNKVHVAFPTSINIAVASVNAFIVTKAPYHDLSRTSQMEPLLRSCMQLDTVEPLSEKTWYVLDCFFFFFFCFVFGVIDKCSLCCRFVFFFFLSPGHLPKFI